MCCIFHITLCLIKCWSLWVVMHNFNFMFKSVRWICDALETTGYCSRLLAIHSRLLLLFCDMLNVLIDCILKVLDFLVLFLGIKLHFYTCALYRGSDTRIQCQHWYSLTLVYRKSRHCLICGNLIVFCLFLIGNRILLGSLGWHWTIKRLESLG